jgi:hypothetical protein
VLANPKRNLGCFPSGARAIRGTRHGVRIRTGTGVTSIRFCHCLVPYRTIILVTLAGLITPADLADLADLTTPADPAEVITRAALAEVITPADLAHPAAHPADLAEALPADLADPAEALPADPADPVDLVEAHPVDLAHPAALPAKPAHPADLVAAHPADLAAGHLAADPEEAEAHLAAASAEAEAHLAEAASAEAASAAEASAAADLAVVVAMPEAEAAVVAMAAEAAVVAMAAEAAACDACRLSFDTRAQRQQSRSRPQVLLTKTAGQHLVAEDAVEPLPRSQHRYASVVKPIGQRHQS